MKRSLLHTLTRLLRGPVPQGNDVEFSHHGVCGKTVSATGMFAESLDLQPKWEEGHFAYAQFLDEVHYRCVANVMKNAYNMCRMAY